MIRQAGKHGSLATMGRALIGLSIFATSFGADTAKPSEKMVFLMRGADIKTWCAYADAARRSEDAKDREGAGAFGSAKFEDGHLREVTLVEDDEAGDWEVEDVYIIGTSGEILQLKRLIKVLPGDVREELLYRMRSGRAIKSAVVFRSLMSGKVAPRSDQWTPEVEIVTRARDFPFIKLLTERRAEVSAQGRVCVGPAERE
jgi:hypothetical protein